MGTLWYQHHRALFRGMRGTDVVKAQKALNKMGANPILVPDGAFGHNTERATKDFQELMRLVVDGKIGAVTYAVLMETSVRYELRKPPFVSQGSPNLCWAACLESVLKSDWPGRPHLSIQELRGLYKQFIRPQGEITIPGLRKVEKDLRVEETLRGKQVRAEFIFPLLQSRRPLLIIDSSTGNIMHTRVLYGVYIDKGTINFLLMDPMKGYQKVDIGTIQSLKRIGFLKAL